MNIRRLRVRGASSIASASFSSLVLRLRFGLVIKSGRIVRTALGRDLVCLWLWL